MDILILSTADWEHPFWTNKQHVALSLSKAGHRVIYLDSLGLRKKIKIATRDRSRILKRLRHIFSSPRKVKNNLWVISPLVFPGIQAGALAWVNRLFLNWTLAYAHKKLGFRCDVLWTYSPATTLYLNPSKFRRSIYHCVDDISAQPNMPKREIKLLERKIASKVDHVVVTNTNLSKSLSGLSRNLHLMPNVVEYKHFSSPSTISIKKAEALYKNIPRPIVGFVGAISHYKLNFELLLEAVDTHTNYSFVLIGSIGEGEESTDVSKLCLRKNIFFLGPQTYADLPGLMSKFDVGILPSRKNDYTNSMFPMKFFEYLAAGIPVVAVDIESLIKYSSVATLCHDAKSFSTGIAKAIESGSNFNDKERRQSLASQNTYKKRTAQMLELINE